MVEPQFCAPRPSCGVWASLAAHGIEQKTRDMITQPGSLVLYKNRPARVMGMGDRVEIELEGGKSQRVRSKDVVLLHPGPLQSLSDLQPQEGDVETAWELLAGATTTLIELAELAYGAYTPATAWDTWQLVAEGLYFHGTPDVITVCLPEDVERERTARNARAAEKAAWESFLARARNGHTRSEDERYLKEIEARAFNQRPDSRVVRELTKTDSPEAAHALLLALG